jgi:hypothetical protein
MNAVNTRDTALDTTELPYIVADMKYGTKLAGVDRYRYDTVERARTNLVLETRPVRVYDATSRSSGLSFQDNGFAVQTHHSRFARLANDESVAQEDFLLKLRHDYQQEMTGFIGNLSGSAHVYPQPIGFFVRHGRKSKVRTPQRPAALPHVDFTAETANAMARMIRDDCAPGLQYRNFAIYQTWRTVSAPPQDNVLCFCNPFTATVEDFKLVESIMGPEDVPGNVYKMQMGLFSPAHEWFYFSALTADDVLVFQGYDTRHPCPVLHTSVDNPVPGAAPRVSIECRHYAFFE